MKVSQLLACGIVAACGSIALARYSGLEEQNALLFERLQRVHGLSDGQMAAVRKIFARSGYVGQGNPAISRHPLTPEQCREKVAAAHATYENRSFEAICNAKFMAPLYDPAKERPEDAKACIDQFEFPDIPCEYPVVWVKAREAAEICAAEGKRLCDAHEWEGACDGSLDPPDYRFDLAYGPPNAAVARMEAAHNQAHKARQRWSYGPEYQKGICAASSQKSDNCIGGGWNICGSNTFPDGSFPECRSPLGVYDLNGNAAEHMNLPLAESQMSSRGSRELGYTEMKGSWFIFDRYRAHPDWCRWRAPYWHGSRVMDEHSHSNYHLGFRCCKTVGK
jgi:formylglycine-generating enzyme required for sulfatase activity